MFKNGIPLFYFFFNQQIKNKKVIFNGMNVMFQYGLNVLPAYLYQPRNSINMPLLKKTGEKGSTHYCCDGKIR